MANRNKKKKKKLWLSISSVGSAACRTVFVLEGMKVAAGVDLDPASKYAYENNNNGAFLEKDISALTGTDLEELFTGADIKVS